MQTGYVAALFDEYCDRFDAHLVERLSYRAPQVVLRALREVCAAKGRPFRFRARARPRLRHRAHGRSDPALRGTAHGRRSLGRHAGEGARQAASTTARAGGASSASCGRGRAPARISCSPPMSSSMSRIFADFRRGGTRARLEWPLRLHGAILRRGRGAGRLPARRGRSLCACAKLSSSECRIARFRGRASLTGRDAPGRGARCRGLHGRARERAVGQAMRPRDAISCSSALTALSENRSPLCRIMSSFSLARRRSAAVAASSRFTNALDSRAPRVMIGSHGERDDAGVTFHSVHSQPPTNPLASINFEAR